jgi:spermidine synthase
VFADQVTSWGEDKFYAERIVHSASSPYQRIVITQHRGDTKLFLNGNLQFNSRDEYRYHEALVHPALAAHGAARKVAVLGGGDGLAIREVLKHPSVESITLVELDPHITRMFAEQPNLRALNGDALNNRKVNIINTDAFKWLEQSSDSFDVIVVDFPDPSNYSLGKLYSSAFYTLLDQRLAASGYAVIQTTSPLIARKSYWTVAATLESVGLQTAPYHAHVPSFGEWGFIIAGRRNFTLDKAQMQLPADLKFLNATTMPLLFNFPPDMARVEASVNRLNNQTLVHTFEQEWGRQ